MVPQIVHALPQPHCPPVPIIHHITCLQRENGAHLRPNVLAGITRFRWGAASVFPQGTVKKPTTFPNVLTCSITARHSDRVASGLVRSLAMSLACRCEDTCMDAMSSHACAYYAILSRQQWIQCTQVICNSRVQSYQSTQLVQRVFKWSAAAN